MKNKEGKDFAIWKRVNKENERNDIFKVNVKTWELWIIDKNWNIMTFHKSNDFLDNPTEYKNKNE